MKYSQGTPQQQAEMRNFRLSNQSRYTQQAGYCEFFAQATTRMKAMIALYWSDQQAQTMMAFLINRSWDYTDPYGFLCVWTLKTIGYIEKGLTFADLVAEGVFKDEGSLFPADNSFNEDPTIPELMDLANDLSADPAFLLEEQARLLLHEVPPNYNSN